MPTVADHLERYLTNGGAPHALEGLAKLTAGLVPVATAVQLTLRKVAELPPSVGYEPMLIERGFNRFAARGISRILIRHGQRTPREREKLPEVIRAIRFLAKSRKIGRVTLRHIHSLLEIEEATGFVDSILTGFDVDALKFIGLLKTAATNPADYTRLVEFASTIAPLLSIPRGPKISAASATHQFVSETLSTELNLPGYTRDEINERFTDPLTLATCREFGEPNFDPRPAYRRSKKRNPK